MRTSVRFALLLLMPVMSLTSLARAGEAGPETAQADTVPIMTMSVRSFASIMDLAKKFSIPVPPHVSAESISTPFPFVGPKGIDPQRPLLVSGLIGDGLTQQQKSVIMLPAVDSTSFFDQLKRDGAKPVLPGSEVYSSKGVLLRATKDYVYFGGTAKTLHALNEPALLKAAASGSTLLRVDFDLTQARARFPAALKKLFDDARAAPELDIGNAAYTAGRQWGQKLSKNFLTNTLNRLAMEISVPESGDLTLRFMTSPFPNPLPAEFDLPGVPRECVFRMDTPCSMIDLADKFDAIWQLTADNDATLKNAPPEARQAFVRYLNGVARLLMMGDCTTFSVAEHDGEWCLYLVKQFNERIDFPAKVESVFKQGKAVTALVNQGDVVRLSVYAGGSGAVDRLEFLSNGVGELYIDSLQRGNTVYMTLAGTHQKYIANIAALPLENGKVKGATLGWLDVARMLKSLVKNPTLPLAAMDEAEFGNLMKALGDKKITFSGKTAADGLTAEINLPLELLGAAVKAAVPPPAPAPAAKK